MELDQPNPNYYRRNAFVTDETTMPIDKISSWRKYSSRIRTIHKFISLFVIFSIIYIILFFISNDDYKPFNNTVYEVDDEYRIPKTIVDGLYFASTTTATVGYGDLLPIKFWSKLIVSAQHLSLIYIMLYSLK